MASIDRPFAKGGSEKYMNCPICQNHSDRIFQKDEFWILKCINCGHQFVELTPTAEHPQKIYNEDYFKGESAGYADYLGEANILLAHGRQYGPILNKYTTPGTLLDIGAAAGFILQGLQDYGWRGKGLEPNSSMADYGRSKLGLEIEIGSLESYNSNQMFDLVSMIQVIAHFYNIRRALKNAADATKPGGFWLIETWNRESWIARILGKYWHEYTPPGVLNVFSPTDLSLLIAQFGFSEVSRGKPEKQISGAHVKSLLCTTLNNTPLKWMRGGLSIIPDKFVFPYPAYDLFWMLFQKDRDVEY